MSNPETPDNATPPGADPPKAPDPRPAPTPDPPATPPVVPDPPKAPDYEGRIGKLEQMIAGLPERIADAMKESGSSGSTPPASSTPPANPEIPDTPGETKGKRSFADRWFGIK